MANWFGNNIVITAETAGELLDYIKAAAAEDQLGAVDSVEAYISALNEGNKMADDGLWLSNPPGGFVAVELLAGNSLAINVRTPNISSLFHWAEKVLDSYRGLSIAGTSTDTMNDNSYELSTVSKEEGDGRTITGTYIPKEWELEENQIDIPDGTVEFVVPLDRPANGVISCLEMPMSLRKIVFHDNIREISKLAGENYNEEYNVEEVVLGKNAHTIIGPQAFCQLPHLKRIVIPSGTWVGSEAFYGCMALEEVVIEGDIEVIAPNAFCNSNLEQVMAERYPEHFVLPQIQRIMDENNTMEDCVEMSENGKHFFTTQDYSNEYLVHKAEIVGEGMIKYSIYTKYLGFADWGDYPMWSALLTKTVQRVIPRNCVDDEDAVHEHFVNSLSRVGFICLMNEGKQPDATEFVDEKAINVENYKDHFTALGFEVDESRNDSELQWSDFFGIVADRDKKETPEKGRYSDDLPF